MGLLGGKIFYKRIANSFNFLKISTNYSSHWKISQYFRKMWKNKNSPFKALTFRKFPKINLTSKF